MNMGYIPDTARNRTHNLFRPKREPILLGHNDGQYIALQKLADVHKFGGTMILHA